jgi:hypothetical protein
MLRWTPKGFIKSQRDKICVVTFANAHYTPHAEVLKERFRKWNPTIDVQIFHDFSEIGSPRHSDNPYAFKVYAVETMRKRGYDIVLWADSILKLQKPLDPILDIVRNKGLYLQKDGWKVGEYASDYALEYFGKTRDEVMNLPSIWANFMAFDFRHSVTNEFFRKWKQACVDNVFCGQWSNWNSCVSKDPRCKGHRHDQTCAELIAYSMGIELQPQIVWFKKEQNGYFIGRAL